MADLPFDTLRAMVSRSVELTQVARDLSTTDRRFYDGDQWTEADKAELQRRKQPIVTINRIQRKVDAMSGIEQRSRTDPRALPVNPDDEQAADVVTKALVYVDERTRFDAKRTAAFENMVVEGYGGVEIIVEPNPRGQLDVVVNRVRWEELFFDPYAREKDFSDASYIGIQRWMTVEDALELYGETWAEKRGGDREQALSDLEEMLHGMLGDDAGQSFEDRPRDGAGMSWADRKQKRVRVAQMYYRRGGAWYLAILTGAGEIVNGVSPYQDEFGRPSCPILLMTAYIDQENRRYGVVRSMISPQMEVNARRSKMLHMLNSRQTQGIKGAVNVAALKREMAKADGHVEIDPAVAEAGVQPFSIINNNDQLAGQAQLLVEAKNEIDMLGPNASLIGQIQGQQSGRAILAQQQAGLIELAPIYDSLRDWTLRCYRAMWARIRQFWTEERWIRITDDVNAPEFIRVNHIVGRQIVMDPQTGMPQIVPQIENALSEVDVDIVIDEAPDFVTLRQEQFEQLTQMAQAGIPIPPEMIVEASNLRDKPKILEAMRESQMAAQQAQAAQAQQVQAMAEARISAEVGAKAARAERDRAAAMETMAGLPETAARGQKAQVEAAGSQIALQRSVLGF